MQSASPVLKKETLRRLLILIAVILIVPYLWGLAAHGLGMYPAAATCLRLYPFAKSTFLSAAQQAGDACLAEGNQDEAVEWYRKMDEAGSVSIANIYCAEASQAWSDPALPWETGSEFMALIPKTPESIAIMDGTRLESAQLLYEAGRTEDALRTLDTMEAPADPDIQKLYNAIYLTQTCDVLSTARLEPVIYDDTEPEIFSVLRSALDIVNQCRDSAQADACGQALQALLEEDVEQFKKAFSQLLSQQAEASQSAADCAALLWNCYGYLRPKPSSWYNGTLNDLLETGYLLADPEAEATPALMDALARLAEDGNLIERNQGISTDFSPTKDSLESILLRCGTQERQDTKILFLREYKPLDYSSQVCALDMQMMSLLPQSLYPQGLEEVSHIVVLSYNYEIVKHYFGAGSSDDADNDGYTAGLQEQGQVRVYALPDTEAVYASEVLYGPIPSNSIPPEMGSPAYLSGGAIALDGDLREALELILPESN